MGLRTKLWRFWVALGLVFFVATNGASANNINTAIPNWSCPGFVDSYGFG
jgi:hypothetical protein